MKIDSTDFQALPYITSATLSESADSASVLTLEWQGYGPDWLAYMLPVTVMHRGRVLFHGRVTSFNRTNEAGDVQTRAVVSNAMWLLDNLTLGAQVAEMQAANETSAVDLQAAGQQALQSWVALAQSCQVEAPLWVATEDGEACEDGHLWLDVSAANFSAGAFFQQDKVITAWTALLTMKRANPDAFYRYNPTTGAVEVISIKNAEIVEWSTESMRLTSCADIGPQYENCITGVALVVSWQAEKEGGNSTGGSIIYTYPEGISEGDMGVKVFSAMVEDAEQMEAQSKYMMKQIRNYYNACNELLYRGSVVALMDDVTESPLCYRLNITGIGTHGSWHSMAAMVTGVEWDFLEGTVEAVLGAQFDEPEIAEMTFPEPSEQDEDDDISSSTTTDDGGISFSFPMSSSTTTTWEPNSTTTWEYSTTWEETTTTWEYTTTWEETTTTWEYTTTWEETQTEEHTTTAHGTTTISGSGSSTGSASWASSTGSYGTGSGSIGSGSDTPPKIEYEVWCNAQMVSDDGETYTAVILAQSSVSSPWWDTNPRVKWLSVGPGEGPYGGNASMCSGLEWGKEYDMWCTALIDGVHTVSYSGKFCFQKKGSGSGSSSISDSGSHHGSGSGSYHDSESGSGSGSGSQRPACDCAADREALHDAINAINKEIEDLKEAISKIKSCECESHSESGVDLEPIMKTLEIQRLFNTAVWAYLFNTSFGVDGFVSFPGLRDIMSENWEKQKNLSDYKELFQG